MTSPQTDAAVIVERPASANPTGGYHHFLPNTYVPPTDGTRNLDTLMYEISRRGRYNHHTVYTADWLDHCLATPGPLYKNRTDALYQVW